MSDWKLLNTSTASGASSVEFTDLTGYKIFKFVFIDCHVNTNSTSIGFNTKTTGSYGLETISTAFRAAANEANDSATLTYETARDQEAGTPVLQRITDLQGSASDACSAGEVFLFDPQSTIYVKHFYSRMSDQYLGYWGEYDAFTSGYVNTAAALGGIEFEPSAGTFDAVIKQYGLVAS